MENTGNSGSGGSPPSNGTLVWYLEPSEMETAEALQTLFDMFQATHDIDYLNPATEMAEQLAVSDRRNVSTLNDLMETRDTHIGGEQKNLEQANVDSESENIVPDNLEGGASNQTSTPYEDPAIGRDKIGLIQSFSSMFVVTGELDYLESAIRLARELAAPDDLKQQIVNVLMELRAANMAQKKVKQAILGRGSALDDNQEGETSNQTSSLHVDSATRLEKSELLQTFHNMFAATGKPGCLERMKVDGKARDTGVADDSQDESSAMMPERYRFLKNAPETMDLTKSFRFDTTNGIEHLKNAIPPAEELVRSPPSGNGLLPLLHMLISLLNKRYDRAEGLEDLGRITEWVKKAAEATPPNNTHRWEALRNLSRRLLNKYDRLRVDGLKQAIEQPKEAVAAIPPGGLKRAEVLANLGEMLKVRYERNGAKEDLDQAITVWEKAAGAAPSDNPLGKIMNLASKHSSRYDRSGMPEDLIEAIKLTKRAVAATPPGDRNRVDTLNRLAVLLSTRYDRFGAPEDLAESIKLEEEAVAETPLQGPNRATLLNNLGMWLSNRYERFGAPDDLVEATRYTEEAVAATPLGAPTRAGMLSNLSQRLSQRYDRFGAPEDLARAIKCAEGAVEATPWEGPNRAKFLCNLGARLFSKYASSRVPEDLEQALKQAEAAAATIPHGHLGRPAILSSLARCVSARYALTGATKDFNYILRISFETWHSRISPPGFRIQAALTAATHLTERKLWQESSSILRDAVKMLPKVSSMSAARDEQEHRLSNFGRLAADAVSTALQAGEEALHCLRLLEFGRGVITGLVIDCRSDISELQSKHPELFGKLRNLRSEIDSPQASTAESSENQAPVGEQTSRRREEVVSELDEILVSIRELPGFEGFQLPPCSRDLMTMACEGPIVIVNSTELRSDAIIVTRSAVKAVTLPKLIYRSAQEWMSQIAQLVQGRRCTYQRRNERMRELLQWLWDTAVEPVFQSLQLDMMAGDSNLPRIWWIGIGLLATAPFHAAGDHSPGSAHNTLSRAISSYIPTIKALSYAHQKKLELLDKAGSRLLLVSMPTTPGKKPLKNATREVEDIVSVIKGKTMTTQLDRPSTAQVLVELPSCHAVHFACHGVSDGASPSNSSLLLRKDDGSETLDKLTVRTISNTNIEHAQIAYLSACSTAENASAKLADESIYIASGFQLAGFSHVLATQWVSHDASCRQVAKDFYRTLFNGQPGGEEGHRKVSAAFHYAVKRLRDDIWKQPIKWASFIHTGA